MAKLLRRPGRARVLGNGDVHDASAVVREHDQDEQQPIRDRWHHKEVSGHDLLDVVC